jgi:hypothetical protein
MSKNGQLVTKKQSMDKIDELLVDFILPQSSSVSNIIKHSLKTIGDTPLNKILTHNKFEKIVPFNLWFRHNLYKVSNNYENNQNMRIRYFNSMMLTPLVSCENNNLEQIRAFLPDFSLYQPFYPETFYAVWEFLQKKHLNPNSKEFLHIGREERLGGMEALIFYHEKYQHTYQHNIYHSWLAGKEMYNKLNGSYNTMNPKINYLEQAYKIKFIKSTNELIKYDFISIDCIHLFQDIFQWNEEELDLHANLFYILTALRHLKQNSSMLIRLNMIGRNSWSSVFNIVFNFFKEHTFIRPSILNPFNSEIYLFLNKFEYKSWLDSISNILLKNLYRQNAYKKFYLNPQVIPENPIYQKYEMARNLWINNLSYLLQNFGVVNPSKTNDICEWHASNDLKQIKDLSNAFDDKTMYYVLKTSAKQFIFKPIVPNVLYDKQFYKKLIEKRAELNYYKRIMDTKPSQIFARRRYSDKMGYLLTWEQLTNQIDIYKNLKYILKKQYGAEMVTNAWIKMYEMLNSFPDLIPTDNKIIKTFHLCEAPGAFISAINHFVSSREQKLEWYAQTLKPTYTGSDNGIRSTIPKELALEDHFGLIAAYPNKWLFGDKNTDYSGDITHSTLIKYYASNTLLKNIDFMTADAGLQCDPTELNEQEAYLGKINMGQIICILACLSIGKSAIFKTFLPMSEPLTISMMYLVTHLFNNVTIAKPSSSHSSNSEVYIILRDYKGIEKNMLEILYGMLDDPKITSKTLLFSEIDMAFFKSYMTNVGIFIDRQIQSLCRNYYYYYNLDQIGKYQGKIEQYTDDWLRVNIIFTLRNNLLYESVDKI